MATPTRTAPDCTCTADTDVHLLQQLVDEGHDQREVSHLLWGDPTRAGDAATAAFARTAHRRWVRRAYQAAFPWLRLPEGGAA